MLTMESYRQKYQYKIEQKSIDQACKNNIFIINDKKLRKNKTT